MTCPKCGKLVVSISSVLGVGSHSDWWYVFYVPDIYIYIYIYIYARTIYLTPIANSMHILPGYRTLVVQRATGVYIAHFVSQAKKMFLD